MKSENNNFLKYKITLKLAQQNFSIFNSSHKDPYLFLIISYFNFEKWNFNRYKLAKGNNIQITKIAKKRK